MVVTLEGNMNGQQQPQLHQQQQRTVGGDAKGTTTQDTQQKREMLTKEDIVPVFVEAEEEQQQLQLHNYHQDEEEQHLAANSSGGGSPRRNHHHIMRRFVAVVPSGSAAGARAGAAVRGASCNASSTVDLEDDEEGEASLPYHHHHPQRHAATSLDARIVAEENERDYQRRIRQKSADSNILGGGGVRGGSMSNVGGCYNSDDPCSNISNSHQLSHHDSDDEEWKKSKIWILVGIFGVCTMCLCLAISLPLIVMNGNGRRGGTTTGTTNTNNNNNNPTEVQMDLARKFFAPYFHAIGGEEPGAPGMQMDDDQYVTQQEEEEEYSYEDVLFFSNTTFVTPQYRALEWLVQYDTNEDTRHFIDELLPSLANKLDGGELASHVDEHLSVMMIERLVVAILYFATGGPKYWATPSISVIYELEYYDEYDNDSYNTISKLFLSPSSICEWNTVVGDGDDDNSIFIPIGIGCDDKKSVISIYLGTYLSAGGNLSRHLFCLLNLTLSFTHSLTHRPPISFSPPVPPNTSSSSMLS